MRISRLKNLRYIKREIIFLCDLLISLLSSIVSCTLFIMLFGVVDAEPTLLNVSVASLIVSTVLIILFGLQRSIIRYFALSDMLQIALFALTKGVVMGLSMYLLDYTSSLMYFVVLDALLTAFLMTTIRGFMVISYRYLVSTSGDEKIDAMIYSTLGSNPELVKQLNDDTGSKYRVRGFLTTNKQKLGSRISGQKVYLASDNESVLLGTFKKAQAQALIFTSHEMFKRAQGNVVDFCIQNKIPMYMLGEMHEIDNGTGIEQRQIKQIQIEDLLDRDEIKVDEDIIRREIECKVVMITGAAGSIGSEIVNQVASFGARRLLLFELAETALHELQLKMRRKFPNLDIKYILGDARSKQRVSNVIAKYKPNIIFHAAAYKHVPMIETNPCEGVMTNVWGTVNVAQRAIENGVEKFVMVSTDKAVNPTNVMGATKRIAEMCVQSMNRQNKTAFITTRFGNVLGSNGSVIPLFKQQIAAGGPVTVTHPDIIRYFMSIPEACRLVLQAATMGHAGEILVFDMGKPEKIVNLARKMIKLSGFEPDRDIKIEYTGLRPGEKLYEELFSSDEDMTTSHKKINIAKCREIDLQLIDKTIKKLTIHARNTDVEQTVQLMKTLVPEFLSRNSEFEKYDK